MCISVYGGSLSGQNGSLASPQYPSFYPHDVHYEWTITVDVGMAIRLHFSVMDMEGPPCYRDYLEVLYLFLSLQHFFVSVCCCCSTFALC